MNLILFVTGEGAWQLLNLECEISHFPSLFFNRLRVATVLRDDNLNHSIHVRRVHITQNRPEILADEGVFQKASATAVH